MLEVVGELVASDSIDLRVCSDHRHPIGCVLADRSDQPTRDKARWHLWRSVYPRYLRLAVIISGLRPLLMTLLALTLKGFLLWQLRRFTRRTFRAERWRSEQYFGPSTGAGNQSLFDQIEGLPKLSITDRSKLRSRRPSSGAIVHPEPIMAGSIDMNTLMLCPIVAAKLGWFPDSTTFSRFGMRKATLLHTHCVGETEELGSSEIDTAIHRHGYAVLVREDLLFHLMPYLAKDYEARAWRLFQQSADDEGRTRSAHRKETPPVPSVRA